MQQMCRYKNVWVTLCPISQPMFCHFQCKLSPDSGAVSAGCTCLCLVACGVVEVDDEVNLSLGPEEGWVAGVDEECSVQQAQVFCRWSQLIWESVQHCVCNRGFLLLSGLGDCPSHSHGQRQQAGLLNPGPSVVPPLARIPSGCPDPSGWLVKHSVILVFVE